MTCCGSLRESRKKHTDHFLSKLGHQADGKNVANAFVTGRDQTAFQRCVSPAFACLSLAWTCRHAHLGSPLLGVKACIKGARRLCIISMPCPWCNACPRVDAFAFARFRGRFRFESSTMLALACAALSHTSCFGCCLYCWTQLRISNFF